MSGGWGTPRMTPEPQEEPAAAVVLPGWYTGMPHASAERA